MVKKKYLGRIMCLDCGWIGKRKESKNGKCPKCKSQNIVIHMEE